MHLVTDVPCTGVCPFCLPPQSLVHSEATTLMHPSGSAQGARMDSRVVLLDTQPATLPSVARV
jgi:hypothetical protein